MLTGIDVSKWQATTPPLAGYSFLFARACYGNAPDATYPMHTGNARKAGLVVGAYCFGRSGSSVSVASQVNALLSIAATADLLVLDLESDGANTAMTTAEAADFIAKVHAAGRTIGLYHSQSGFPSIGQDWNWVARWGSTPPSTTWAFWQYQGSPLDTNYFSGTVEQLNALAGITKVGEMDAKVMPNSFVDCKPGGTLYLDQACTQVGKSPWAGGTDVGTYGTYTRADGKVMRAVRVDYSTGDKDLRVSYYENDLCVPVRVPVETDPGTSIGTAVSDTSADTRLVSLLDGTLSGPPNGASFPVYGDVLDQVRNLPAWLVYVGGKPFLLLKKNAVKYTPVLSGDTKHTVTLSIDGQSAYSTEV